MADFEPGQSVKIACSVEPGAFPGERLVMVESEGEKISGFVREEFVREGYVLGRIVSVEVNRIIVKIPGSFFTRAAGRISFSAGWAISNLRPAVV